MHIFIELKVYLPSIIGLPRLEPGRSANQSFTDLQLIGRTL